MNKEFRNKCDQLPKWHPLHTFIDENNHLIQLLNDFININPENDYQAFVNVFNQISQVDIRYTRKENQLFPFLEKRGWTGPSQGMWAFHDSNRAILKDTRKIMEAKNINKLKEIKALVIEELARMMEVEEFRLLPYSLELLHEEDWQQMYQGESEIGFAFGVKQFNDNLSEMNLPKENSLFEDIATNILKMNEGKMTLDQVNLMLKFLPIDLTYVDENDRVIFYNRGEERVFPRSAGVIGREVRFCHPPKSVGTVLQILDEFKKGTKDDAEFWIDYRGKKIHIRYFAIRNDQKEYKGVIEVSQDITQILKITGEKRLLNWNS
jgi:DUF438 domain-containing protein